MIPDDPLPTDLYAAILVKSTTRSVRRPSGQWWETDEIKEFVSSDLPHSITAQAAAEAAEAAAPKAGMTLDELGELVSRAMKAGATGREIVEVTVSGVLHQRIRTAKVTINPATEKQPPGTDLPR